MQMVPYISSNFPIFIFLLKFIVSLVELTMEKKLEITILCHRYWQSSNVIDLFRYSVASMVRWHCHVLIMHAVSVYYFFSSHSCSFCLTFAPRAVTLVHCHARSPYKWLGHNLHISTMFRCICSDHGDTVEHLTDKNKLQRKKKALKTGDEKSVSTSNVTEFFIDFPSFIALMNCIHICLFHLTGFTRYKVKGNSIIVMSEITVNNNLLFKCNLFWTSFPFVHNLLAWHKRGNGETKR